VDMSAYAERLVSREIVVGLLTSFLVGKMGVLVEQGLRAGPKPNHRKISLGESKLLIVRMFQFISQTPIV